MKEIFYDWGGWNVRFFQWINGIHAGPLDTVMGAVSWLSDHERFPLFLAVALASAWIVVKRGRSLDAEHAHERARAWFSVLLVFTLAYILDGIVVAWLKETLNFPRPPAVLSPDTIHVVGTPKFSHSLPSGHALFSMTAALSLWPVLAKWWRAGFAIFVLWVGISRISLGMHFPADVMAGYLLASMIVAPLQFACHRFI